MLPLPSEGEDGGEGGPIQDAHPHPDPPVKETVS
jgi:hypothetical protein